MMIIQSQLMVLHTSNLLLIIRCFTKYIIEIENESALLDQLNARTLTDQSIFLFNSIKECIVYDKN